MKTAFNFVLKAFSVLIFFMFNLKIHDVTAWLTKQLQYTIHILPNISRSKGNQIMKFGQLIAYKKRNTFSQTSCRICGWVTSSRPFLLFKKGLYEVKASGLQLISSTFRYPPACHTIKSNRIKLQTIDLEICLILIFFERDLGYFLYYILRLIFQEKCFHFISY